MLAALGRLVRRARGTGAVQPRDLRDGDVPPRIGARSSHERVGLDVHDGRYWAPTDAGFGVEFKAESVRDYAFPGGAIWTARA